MSSRNGALDRALDDARRLRIDVASELRSERIGAGLSRQALGSRTGVSASRIGRLERAELDDVGLEMVCRLAAGVGLRAAVKLYPSGDAIRDAGQHRLLERLRIRMPVLLGWRPEAPLFGRTDLRAWDAVVAPPGCRDAVEAETRLNDLQAVERRIALKLRDDASIGHVILLVADTHHNRRVLRVGREALRSAFPLDTRETMAALGAGRCPGSNAIVIL
jgi:transcriptional regulator with XRE-family HTH domain